MKKLVILSLVLTTFLSCAGDKKKGESNETATVIANEAPSSSSIEQDNQTPQTETFDWSTVPVTESDLGAFPYFTLPEGFKASSGRREIDLGFGKLELFIDGAFLAAEGRVKTIPVQPEKGDWNQYKFDTSIDKYLLGIGAKKIADGKIPNAKLKELGSDNVGKYVTGDPYNNPIRIFAINHPPQRVFISISSSTAAAYIGIVRLEDFEQTIKKVTADDIKKELDEKGIATLYINFDTGKSRIKQESYEIITAIQNLLEQNPDLKIAIEGHTDDVGDAAENLRLSENRARSVVIALSDEGIDENRLSYKGFGESKPIEDNTTEEGKAKNRRVEIKKIEP